MTPLDYTGYAFAILYGLSMIALSTYGLHGLWLLRYFRKHRAAAAAQEELECNTALPPEADLPKVLIQLPVFNERDVVHRICQAMVALEWPRHLLEIQLLDDSTDDSVEIGKSCIAELITQGLNAKHLHRTNRVGFKAGALEEGMATSDAEYVAIFDADFIPAPDFLTRAIKPFFADENLALVQGRWEHTNREQNMLTRCQAIGIDGHFAIEQGARAWSGLPMNFNGTCGLWRRRAIEDAGGWEHETLTEDLDLSYRAQLKGWSCTYRLGLAVPGELPANIAAWRSQQFRWAKGSMQTAKKLLPRVWRSTWKTHHKIAATLHLTHYAVHPLMLVSLIVAPIALWLSPAIPHSLLFFGLLAFIVGVVSPIATYASSQCVLRGKDAMKYMRHLPALASIGTGIAISNARAVWEAWAGIESPFVRTPKQGDSAGSYKAASNMGIAELLCSLWAVVGISLSLSGGRPWLTPLLLIYCSGFLWVSLLSIRFWFSANPAQTKASWRIDLPLITCALLSIATYSFLSRSSFWVDSAWSWFTAGISLSALYLFSSWFINKNTGSRRSLFIILVAAVLFRCFAFTIPVSNDLNRYVVEGVQAAYSQNPYSVAPLAESTHALMSNQGVYDTLQNVNHPSWTAIYPPLMIAAEMFITHINNSVSFMNLASALAELAAMGFILAILISRNLPPTLILLAAWNPIGPLWLTGEGHNDSFMLAALAAGCWMWERKGHMSSLITLTAAALFKPFAGIALIARFFDVRLRAFLWPTLFAICCYLPFSSAGAELFSSLGRFGADKHYHGAFYNIASEAARLFGLDGTTVFSALPYMLGVIVLAGCGLLIYRDRKGIAYHGAGDHLALTGKLFIFVFLCLPTLYPWYMSALLLFIPFLRHSKGLILWTAMTPVFYLHGLAIDKAIAASGDPTAWAESIPVSIIAHLPAVLFFSWDMFTRSRPWQLQLSQSTTSLDAA